MVCILDTLNFEGKVAFPTDVGILIFLWCLYWDQSTIDRSEDLGNLAILKKLGFFALTMSYGEVRNFTLASFESSAPETLPIIRETVGLRNSMDIPILVLEATYR